MDAEQDINNDLGSKQRYSSFQKEKNPGKSKNVSSPAGWDEANWVDGDADMNCWLVDFLLDENGYFLVVVEIPEDANELAS